jgi:hypothetical protein
VHPGTETAEGTVTTGETGVNYITITAHLKFKQFGLYDIKHVMIEEGIGSSQTPCSVTQECLWLSGGISPDYCEQCGCDTYLVAAYKPWAYGTTMAEEFENCKLLTRAECEDTSIQPTAVFSPLSELRTKEPGGIDDAPRREWGALEISTVSALSTFTTVATTVAAYLCYRLRKNAKNSEDGVRLAIAKP